MVWVGGRAAGMQAPGGQVAKVSLETARVIGDGLGSANSWPGWDIGAPSGYEKRLGEFDFGLTSGAE
jgi:hypothetical protein